MPMHNNLKILVFSVPSWNSKIGANSWATLLASYPSENIASVYIRDEFPDSNICSRYFNISENRILKSIFNRKIKTGREIDTSVHDISEDTDLSEHNERYKKMSVKRRYSMLLARELAWKLGKWKTKELNDFLDDFKPDIILHSMEGYIHLNRITKYAIKRTKAKAIGYIWDDNFTYKQSSAIGYKIYRYFQRKSLKKLAKVTDAFFAISPMTKAEADRFFGINSIVLTKPLNNIPEYVEQQYVFPLRILYTGNLYIGRDKSLQSLVEAIKQFSVDKKYFLLDIYTATQLSAEQKEKMECENCTIHDAISQSEVIKKQKESDILLFLEAMNGKYSRTARLSFSTKLTDYLSTGKPILAIGNEETAPMQYLKDHHAAMIASNREQIEDCLRKIINDPQILREYAINACKCGTENHDPQKIQETFNRVLQEVYNLKGSV